jgi:hypothetical protein
MFPARTFANYATSPGGEVFVSVNLNQANTGAKPGLR